MPKLARSASKKAKRARMAEEMRKYKSGELRSGSKSGPVVTDRDQAIAISLHQAGLGRKSSRKARGADGRRSTRR